MLQVLSLKLRLHRARYEVRTILADHPSLYLPLARLKSRPPATQTVEADTDILIEGWPRSGNTFAEQAFRLAQQRPVNVAHHFHAPAQVIAAARMGLPTLIVVRNAIDSICSFLIRDSALSPEQALRSWIRFHARILPYRHGYVTATFEQVTGDFGRVTERINARFNTGFSAFRHTPENVEKCFSIIEENNRIRFGGGRIVESGISRPSSTRAPQKTKVREKLETIQLQPLLERADEIYAQFRVCAGHD